MPKGCQQLIHRWYFIMDECLGVRWRTVWFQITNNLIGEAVKPIFSEILEMLKESGKISTSYRVCPPALKLSGLKAEQEAESESWAVEE